MADEKIWSVANEFVVSLEELFYTSDIDFDSKDCNYVFYEIIKLFIEKGHTSDYKMEVYKFIKACYEEVDKEGTNNYTLFYDNLNILLELDYINIEDIDKIKVRLNNKFVIQNKDKQLVLSNIS